MINLSESDRTMVGRVEFAHQPEEQQVFSANWELESQVNNGGFTQLFTAADGHSANFAPRALRAINARKCADIVTRALRTASPRDLSIDQAARVALESLDQEFLAYPDKLTDLLFDDVRARPRVFGPIDGL